MIHGFNKFMWVMTLAAGFTDTAGGAEPPASLPEIRQGTDLRTLVWNPQTDPVAAADFMHLFRAEPIAEATAARMRGKSYAEGCPVALSDLRYLILPHFDGQGCIRIGEMVCNRSICPGAGGGHQPALQSVCAHHGRPPDSDACRIGAIRRPHAHRYSLQDHDPRRSL